MKKLFLSVAALTLAASVGAEAISATPTVDEKIQTIDQELVRLEKADLFSGSVVIRKSGQIVYQKAFGYAERETNAPMKNDSVFIIGSVAKQFFGATALILQRQGLLKLTDTLDKYIPFVDADQKQITILQLLTHTSGMRDGGYVLPQDIVQKTNWEDAELSIRTYLQYAKVEYKDHRFEYNNWAYTVLCYIIEKVTGKKVEQVVRELVFTPSQIGEVEFSQERLIAEDKMTFGYNDKKEKQTRADSLEYNWSGWKGSDSIVMSMSTLSNWLEVIRNSTLLTSNESKQFLSPISYFDKYKANYGLGIMVQYSPTGNLQKFFHTGGTPGYYTFAGYDLENDYSITMCSNITLPDALKFVYKTFSN